MLRGAKSDSMVLEPGVMRSAQSVVPVPWQRDHIGPKCSTVVHGWISMYNVTKELKAGGTDDVCEWCSTQYWGKSYVHLLADVVKRQYPYRNT